MPSQEEAYQAFLRSRQPPTALRLAMEGFFAPDVPETYRKAYGDYLKKRVRPMVETLIEREDLEKLEVVSQLRWLTPRLVDEFAVLARDRQKSTALIWLLAKKQELYGFAKEGFEL